MNTDTELQNENPESAPAPAMRPEPAKERSWFDSIVINFFIIVFVIGVLVAMFIPNVQEAWLAWRAPTAYDGHPLPFRELNRDGTVSVFDHGWLQASNYIWEFIYNNPTNGGQLLGFRETDAWKAQRSK